METCAVSTKRTYAVLSMKLGPGQARLDKKDTNHTCGMLFPYIFLLCLATFCALSSSMKLGPDKTPGIGQVKTVI